MRDAGPDCPRCKINQAALASKLAALAWVFRPQEDAEAFRGRGLRAEGRRNLRSRRPSSAGTSSRLRRDGPIRCRPSIRSRTPSSANFRLRSSKSYTTPPKSKSLIPISRNQWMPPLRKTSSRRISPSRAQRVANLRGSNDEKGIHARHISIRP
jgi:hypothetical protein